MAGNAFYVDTDFHTSALSPVDTSVGRLCGDNKFRTDFIFINNVLPAETVAVFFLNSSYNHNLTAFRNQIQILHDSCAVNSRYKTAALVGHTAAADLCLVLVALIGIECPVVNISDSYGVDMCVIRDNSFAGSHVADDISLRINNNLIKIQLFHLSSDCVNVRFFVAALSRVFYNGPQKCGHIFLITLRGLFDFVEIHSFLSF